MSLKNTFSLIKFTWMKFANLLGRVNTKILLSIFYFFILGFVAIIRKGIHCINKKSKQSTWGKVSHEPPSMERVSHQS